MSSQRMSQQRPGQTSPARPDIVVAAFESDSDDDNGRSERGLKSSIHSAPAAAEPPAGTPTSLASMYRNPLSPEAASEALPPGEGGLVWHAMLLSDQQAGDIKPRRGTLPVRAADFFASLVETADGRWIFSGVLNGWPGLRTLELRSITVQRGGRGKGGGKKKKERCWSAVPDAAVGAAGEAPRGSNKVAHASNQQPLPPPPAFPDCSASDSVRATLRMAAWTGKGWCADSPGYLWWFHGQRPAGALCTYGEGIVRQLREDHGGRRQDMPNVTRVHTFAHRYALGEGKKESSKERMMYHEAVLLEWDHGRHLTVVELATLNGVGGRKGKVNWYADKDSPLPALYAAMPPLLVAPWNATLGEIRVSDCAARTLDEFKAFMREYTGPAHAFLDVHFEFSGDCRLMYRSQEDIVRYLLNYIRRDARYTELDRNCQTFAADFYGFAAGKKNVKPFHAVNRALYKDRSHLFFYDPEMYGGSTEAAAGPRGGGCCCCC